MANGVIENSIPANEFRIRIPDKMALKNNNADNSVAKHKIFITDGNIDTVNNNKFVPRIVGKNIIDAVNEASVNGKVVANATHAVNADNATNVVLTTTANADGSTTIKAGTGSARVENCINAKNADFANRGKLSIDNDSTNGDKIWIGTPPATNAVNINNARNARYALYASLDEAKGTIETRLEDINTRLTNLGFKEGSVTNFISGTTLKTQGLCAIVTIPSFQIGANLSINYTGTMSCKAKDSTTIIMYGAGIILPGGHGTPGAVKVTVQITGNTIKLTSNYASQYGATFNSVPIGFEIQ